MHDDTSISLRSPGRSQTSAAARSPAPWRVVVDAERSASAVAQGDQDRTLRILDNLINNALVYSGKGRRVVLRVEDADGLQVAVEDSGAGIPEERRVHLFEPFARDDGQQSREWIGPFYQSDTGREMGGDLTLDDRRAQLAAGSSSTSGLQMSSE